MKTNKIIAIAILIAVIIFTFIFVTKGQIIVDTTITSGVSKQGNAFSMWGTDSTDMCLIGFSSNRNIEYMDFDVLGDYCQGFPVLDIYSSGQFIEGIKIDTTWESKTLHINKKSIVLIFPNDFWSPGTCDRNVHIKNVSFEFSQLTTVDTLFWNEISKWDAYIYKIPDSINVVPSDTLKIGDNFEFSFQQPMFETRKEEQFDPITYEIDTLWKPIHFSFTPGDVTYQTIGDTSYIQHTAGTYSFLQGTYGFTIACSDTANNQSKFCDWRLFYVRTPKWTPFIPIKIIIKSREE